MVVCCRILCCYSRTLTFIVLNAPNSMFMVKIHLVLLMNFIFLAVQNMQPAGGCYCWERASKGLNPCFTFQVRYKQSHTELVCSECKSLLSTSENLLVNDGNVRYINVVIYCRSESIVNPLKTQFISSLQEDSVLCAMTTGIMTHAMLEPSSFPYLMLGCGCYSSRFFICHAVFLFLQCRTTENC